MTTRPHAGDSDEVDVELVNDPANERWVTITEAAELAGVNDAAVRRWYRSGRIPTQRAEGEHGAYLVPLSAVLRLGQAADEQGDDLGDPVVDLNASYWSLETAAARDETATVRAELADAQEQLAFLRDQLREALAGERAAKARADAAETELRELRAMAAATSSITDTSWLDLGTNRYQSPVRSQGMAAPPDLPDVPAARDEAGESDEAPAPVDSAEREHEHEDEDDAHKVDFRPGEHADDLLPAAEKRHRRARH